MLVFKLLLPAEWATFESSGHFHGSPFDMRSGFVHCSSRTQVGATARRFFPEEPALVVVALDTEILGDTLRWEPASDGDVFPHVYGPLLQSAVIDVLHVSGAARVDEALRESESR